MVLLRTSYISTGASSSPKMIEPPPEKHLASHPLKELEHPDKKLYSLHGNILISRENHKPLENYQPENY